MSWELHLGHGKGSGDVELAGRVAAEEGDCAVFIFFYVGFLISLYVLFFFGEEEELGMDLKSW